MPACLLRRIFGAWSLLEKSWFSRLVPEGLDCHRFCPPPAQYLAVQGLYSACPFRLIYFLVVPPTPPDDDLHRVVHRQLLLVNRCSCLPPTKPRSSAWFDPHNLHFISWNLIAPSSRFSGSPVGSMTSKSLRFRTWP